MLPPVWCQSGSPGLRVVCPAEWAHVPGSVTLSSSLTMAQSAPCPQRRPKTVWSMKNAVGFPFFNPFVQPLPWCSSCYSSILNSTEGLRCRPIWPLSSQQLPGYRVGWMGCLQCHLWSWHEEERAHGEDASCRWLHLWGGGARSGEVHDARMSWVAAFSGSQVPWHLLCTSGLAKIVPLSKRANEGVILTVDPCK